MRVLEDVVLGSVQKSDHIRQPGKFLQQFAEKHSDRVFGHLPVQFLEPTQKLPPPFGNLLHEARQFFLVGGELLVHGVFFLLRQSLESLGIDDFTVWRQRSDGDAAGQFQENKPVGLDPLFQIGEGTLLILLEIGLHLAQAFPVFVALESRRDRTGEIVEQLIDIVPENPPFPAGSEIATGLRSSSKLFT